jgi:hypothetical protein
MVRQIDRDAAQAREILASHARGADRYRGPAAARETGLLFSPE